MSTLRPHLGRSDDRRRSPEAAVSSSTRGWLLRAPVSVIGGKFTGAQKQPSRALLHFIQAIRSDFMSSSGSFSYVGEPRLTVVLNQNAG